MMSLRPYQHDAYNAVRDHLASSDEYGGVVCIPTAGGKTVVFASLIRDFMLECPSMRVCILAHRWELLQQAEDKILSVWPDAPTGIWSAGLKRKDRKAPILIAGIQTIHNKAFKLDPYDLIIVDEAHLVPNSAETMYGKFLGDCWRMNRNVRFVGFTATPYRLDGGFIYGQDRIFSSLIYQADVRQLIDDGWLCPLRTKDPEHQIATEGVHVRRGDFVDGELERAALLNVRAACKEIVSLAADRKSWLIFACGIEHAHQISQCLAEAGIEAPVVLGDTDTTERRRIIRDFDAGFIRAVVNVGCLTTGLDVTRIDCIACLRPTKSTSLWVQMCLDSQTEILTEDGWKSIGQIKIGERTASLNLETGKGVWSTVTQTINRQIVDGESFVSLASPRIDIRVTDQHDMIFKKRQQGSTSKRWETTTAIILASQKNHYSIPSAITIDTQGVSLTDDEIRFIGLFLTDGTIDSSNQAITIYQSERYPEVINFIKATLDGCGIKYSHYRRMPGDICFGKPRVYAIHRFQISKGKPRGTDLEKRGWEHLLPFINKEFSEELLKCSKHQTEVLLEAMHMGDGDKKFGKDKYGWVVRSYSICGKRKCVMDKLQALCVTRGLSANLSHVSNGPSKKIYKLYVSFRDSRCIGGASQNDRKSFSKELPGMHEHVWCVETEHGTIVTRRNGKVAVVGNCGRGCRLHTGKTDCLVLDFGGNVRRHGPLDDLLIKEPGRKTGEAPLKRCPECRELVGTALRKCPGCGYVFPPPKEAGLRHDAKADSIPVISSESWIEHPTQIVTRIHKKEGSPESLRVDYRCGLMTYSEWVCFGHNGWPREKAARWWYARTFSYQTPSTAQEAFDELSTEWLSKITKAIKVRKQGRFFEIVSAELDTTGMVEPHGTSDRTGAAIQPAS